MRLRDSSLFFAIGKTNLPENRNLIFLNNFLFSAFLFCCYFIFIYLCFVLFLFTRKKYCSRMKKIKRCKLCFTFNQGVVLFMPFIITDAIILKYLNDGFSYLEMVELLNHVHDFQISLSNRKR